MKATKEEVKEILEFKITFSKSSLPDLIKNSDEGEGILEQLEYYKPEEFYVYCDGLANISNCHYSIKDVINWLSLARGTIIFSIFENKCAEGSQLVEIIELFDNCISSIKSINVPEFSRLSKILQSKISELIPKN